MSGAMVDAGTDRALYHIGYEGIVRAEWIDVNEHMNVRWYDHVFDNAEHDLVDNIGLTEAYIAANGFTVYRVEKHVRYERELLLGEQILVSSRIVYTDGRVLKHRHELFNLTRNIRAACADYTSLHVDLSKRKSARISDPVILDSLHRLANAHGAEVAG